MIQLKEIAKNEKFSNLLLGGLFLYPFLPFNIVSILVIALIFSVIGEKIILKDFNFDGNKKNIYFGGIFYGFLLVTILYSENLNVALKEAQKTVPFLIFPILFFLKNPISKRNIKMFLLIFIFANFLFLVLLYRYFLIDFFNGCYYEMSLLPLHIKIRYIYNVPFYRLLWCAEKFREAPFFVHKVYNSMHLLFSIAAIYYLFKKHELNKTLKIVLIFFLILFVLMIVNMVSLVNLSLLFVLTLLFVLSALMNYKFSIIKKSVILLLILLIGFFLFKKGDFEFIFKETNWISHKINDEIQNDNKVELQLDNRFFVNSCNISIIKSNPILGVGLGDVQDRLNKCYLDKSEEDKIYKDIYMNQLNSHNQYMSFFIAGGLVLLCLLLLLLFNGLKEAIIKKNYIYVVFILIISINLLFESMFSRMYGVLFFCLFHGILTNCSTNEELKNGN